MNRRLYIDCDGVIFDSIYYAFQEMKKLGIDLNDQIQIGNYFKQADWTKLLAPDKIINDSIKKINMLRDSRIFLNICILTHVSSFYEAIYKTEVIEAQVPGIDVITIPLGISKDTIVNPIDNILIDDSKTKIKNWINRGGIGVLFNKESDILYNNGEHRIIEPFELGNEQNYFITNDLADLIEIERILNSKRKVMKP